MKLLILGLLAGVDNLQVATALSVAPIRRGRRALLALAFAIAETASPLAGYFAAHAIRTRFGVSFDGIAPFVVIGCGIAILALALRGDDDDAVAKLVSSRWTLVGLPLSLSFDNLFIGISVGTLGYPPVLAGLVIGGTSALVCVAAVAFGAQLGRLIPRRPELVSGAALIIIATSMWIRS